MEENKQIEWISRAEAEVYYDVHPNTLHNWRRNCRVETRETMYGRVKGYKYEKSEELKSIILSQRKFDKRFKKI